MENRAETFKRAIDLLLILPDLTGMARCKGFYELYSLIMALDEGTGMLEEDLAEARKEIEELNRRIG